MSASARISSKENHRSASNASSDGATPQSSVITRSIPYMPRASRRLKTSPPCQPYSAGAVSATSKFTRFLAATSCECSSRSGHERQRLNRERPRADTTAVQTDNAMAVRRSARIACSECVVMLLRRQAANQRIPVDALDKGFAFRAFADSTLVLVPSVNDTPEEVGALMTTLRRTLERVRSQMTCPRGSI